MAYVCELGNGRSIYLDNQGTQTIVTVTISGPGQQQQTSNSMQTGAWASPPEMYRTAAGAIIKLHTAQGDRYIRVEGSNIRMTSEFPGDSRSELLQTQQVASSSTADSASTMSSMQPIKPMEPMKPMTMGDMQMSMNPMQMQMGDMQMSMGGASTGAASATRQFCSQCGTSVQPSDRFCASCGHRLEN